MLGVPGRARKAGYAAPWRPGVCLSIVVLAGILAACRGGRPPAETGVEGTVTMGPMCPVVQVGQACPDAPYAARLSVVRASGKIVARASAGEDGSYRIALEAGDYLLQAEPSDGGPFPASAGVPFSVVEGAWTRLDVVLDSGIR
jgi:hypothetical protein